MSSSARAQSVWRAWPRSPAAYVTATASAVSLTVFIHLYRQGLTNIYGDGLAHINIARKVVDNHFGSLWQSYLQLGSPWLPLQHALMLPLVWNDFLWRSGMAGSFVSMASYIVAAALLFVLARRMYQPAGDASDVAHSARRDCLPFRLALLSSGILVFNPSLLYLQTTPMTEPLFLAMLVASIWSLARWDDEQTPRRLILSAVIATLTALTRYEGWAMLPAEALVVLWISGRPRWGRLWDAVKWSAVAAIGPIYWFAHNWIIYHDPLWFFRGPYSAHAIFEEFSASLSWSSFVIGSVSNTLSWASLTVTTVCTFAVAVLGLAGFAVDIFTHWRNLRSRVVYYLLGVPFLFFCYSLYRGEIQVFPIKAISIYNVRYGLAQLVPLALFAPGVVMLFRKGRSLVLAVAVAALVLVQYAYVLSDGFRQLEVAQEPIRNNINSAEWLERANLDAYLNAHPPPPLVILDGGFFGPDILRSKLRFVDTIHDGDPRWPWLKEIPPDANSLIMRKDDQVWKRFAHQQSFARDFQLVFQTSGEKRFQVYERK